MANIITLCLLFTLSNFLLVNFVVGKSSGLKIRLVHPDSPESPFYQPNYNFTERIKMLIHQSKARLKYFSTPKLKKPNDIGVKIDMENQFVFMAKLGIGSFPTAREGYKSYYFHMDIGSDLTWLECKDCKHPGNHCLRPNGKPFPNDKSKTYKKLKCNHTRSQCHPLCNPRDCIGEFCGYKMEYEDDSVSKGFLAKEKFTFTTAGPSRTESHDLVFGCGVDMRNMGYENGSKVAGILGLGWGPSSFVKQLGRRSNGKFSYCLQKKSQSNVSTYLQFGDHIPTSRAIYSTPLREIPREYGYFVDLIDITAAGRSLNLTEHDFSRKPNNTGGCVLDSGTIYTLIVDFAYEKLKQRLMAYFSNFRDLVRVEIERGDFCYKRMGAKRGFRNLPAIIFHFQNGANLELEPESTYSLGEIDGKEVFCLEMVSNDAPDRLTVIGAYQQMNHRFNYHTRQKMLHFGPENCARSV